MLVFVLLLCASEYLTHFALLLLLFNAVCTSTWAILAGRDSGDVAEVKDGRKFNN